MVLASLCERNLIVCCSLPSEKPEATDGKKTQQAKGQLISEWLLDVFIWTKKLNKNISVFLPYLSKIGQIKKRMEIIISEDK